jgi:TonB family protein
MRAATIIPRAWLCLLLLANFALGMTSVEIPTSIHSTLDAREREAWKSPLHAAQFRTIPYTSVALRCEDTQLPEALTTPDPLFVPSSTGLKVKISLIVGTDGHVHSPLILQSSGILGDRNILQVVRAWRYRPATCNGVPTEAEGQIEFSRR